MIKYSNYIVQEKKQRIETVLKTATGNKVEHT